MDDENGGPEPFKGMPERFGQDASIRTLARIHANAGRIKIS
jgi:hypothetical protein